MLDAVPELRPQLYYGPVLVFFRHDDGLTSFGLTENAGLSTTDPLVEPAWLVNGLDADVERRIAEVVRAAAG